MFPVAAVLTALVLRVVLAAVSSPVDQWITAEPGQNVTLPCRSPDPRSVLVVEWDRTDLGSDYVLLFRDDQFDPEGQHPSFKDRVDLQDRLMNDGDVSLVLKDVTTEDSGTYECRVDFSQTNRRKRAAETDLICIIQLQVSPPPPGNKERQTGGQGGQPGGQGGQPGDRGDKGRIRPGLIVALGVLVVICVIVAVPVIVRTRMSRPPRKEAGEPGPL